MESNKAFRVKTSAVSFSTGQLFWRPAREMLVTRYLVHTTMKPAVGYILSLGAKF
jgi:hypothetical protein